MQQLLAQYPWLVLLAAVLVGMLILWLLEMFILRRAVKRDLTNLEASLKQRDADLQTAQTELAQTNAAFQDKQNELQNVQGARAVAENQLADLKPQLARTSAELDATRQARQQLETTLDARTAEANDLRSKLAALVDGSNAQRTRLESLGKERDELRSALTSSRSHHREAAAEVVKLTAMAAASAAALQALERSGRELTAQTEFLNAELKHTRANAEQLSSSLAETNAARLNLESMLQESRRRARELSSAHSALEELAVELARQNRELDDSVEKLTTGTLAAAALIKRLEAEIAALTKQHVDLQKAKALDDVKLAELEQQIARVNAALGITMHDKQTYERTLYARVQELGDAHRELARTNQENSELLRDVAKFSTRAATAAALIRALESNRREWSGQEKQLLKELDGHGIHQAASHPPARPVMHETMPAAPDKNADHPSAEWGISGMSSSENGITRPAAPAVSQTTAASGPNGEHAHDDRIALGAKCPQDLCRVRGIGQEFEHRLYNAGIGTYWDLSQLGDEELATTLRLNETQRAAVNLAAIRGDALRLARETNSQNRTWKGAMPDDFAMLIGVGRVYARRLYDAGICTFASLARSKVDRVALACHASQMRKSDYQSWIDQARVLVKARRRGM